MKKTLKIELLSPFLPGSGTGNGAFIDEDCTFNSYGFPILPSRRLKGCLREAATKLKDMNLCRNEDILSLFGTAEHEGHLQLGNAELEHSEDIRQGIDECSRERGKRFLLSNNAIENYFSEIHTFTAINEKGVTEKHSLRTIRVLKKGLTFVCPISFHDDEKDLLENCVKLLRHIGTNRNRGMGEVRCTLADEQKEIPPTVENFLDENDSVAVLKCVLLLETPVIMEAGYVPGVIIRGVLSALYMKTHPAPESGDYTEDEAFRRLFLENLRFEPAFPTDRKGNRYTLAGKSIVRYKIKPDDQSEYIDLSVSKHPDKQTKSVKELYLYRHQNTMYALEPKFERHMHHAQSGELFEYTALAQGTRLLMRVSGNREAIQELSNLLSGVTHLRFGKSHSAEYGIARIISHNIQKDCDLNTGKKFVFTLQSPVLLEDKYGTAQPTCQALCNALGETAGVSLKLKQAFCDTTFLTGYNAQWRLNKQPVSALDRGTVIVTEAEESISLPENLWIGSRFSEGYGLIRTQIYENISAEFDITEWSCSPNSYENDTFNCFLLQFQTFYIRESLKKYAFNCAFSNAGVNSGTCQMMFTLLESTLSIKNFIKTLMEIKDPKKRENCLNLFSGNAYHTLSAHDKMNENIVLEKIQKQFNAILSEAICPQTITPILDLNKVINEQQADIFFRFYWTIFLENAAILGRGKEAML